MCIELGESVKNEASGYSKMKTKSSLVSREELSSLGLAVLNSITVPFLFIFFVKSKAEYNTRQTRKKIKNKGMIMLCRFSRHFP